MQIRTGSDRNEDYRKAHLYAADLDHDLLPMCGYGWNRSNGQGFSILRGHWLSDPQDAPHDVCKICLRNVLAGKDPTKDGWPHKTKWL